MEDTIFMQIKVILDQHQATYQLKVHPPTYTSEESAVHRGEPLKIGAKAMVLKTDQEFVMLVIPGDRKIDSNAVKRILVTKNLRFATKEELGNLTGLVPGAIPPFGLLFNLPMLVDRSILEEDYIAFNAGSLEKSIKMKTKDYISLVVPRLEELSIGKV